MERISKFLQLQFCMLLLLLTVLPEFNLLSSLLGFNFDIPKFACKVLGLIGGGMAFYYRRSIKIPTTPYSIFSNSDRWYGTYFVIDDSGNTVMVGVYCNYSFVSSSLPM